MLLLSLILVRSGVSSTLGPGRGAWKKGNPQKLGLIPSKLVQAAQQYSTLASPTCFAIIRDGELVLDKTYGFGAKGRRVESMSAGKTATAAVMGVAHRMGMYDLDTPIHTYGVPGSLANWSDNTRRIDYYPKVTARHLLSQSTGVGKYPPATRFTYDSDVYISYLSYLLDATSPSNMTALQFATDYFATPLGIPDLYAYQRLDPEDIGDTPARPKVDISAGGDQPLTCPELARVGQLLLNKGVWVDSNHTPYTMIKPSFVKEMFTVHHPSLGNETYCAECHQYSLLSYVVNNNTPPAANQTVCRPWNASSGGVMRVPGLPNGTLMALGSLARMMMVVPQERMVVVAFGSADGSIRCPNGTHEQFTWAQSLRLSQVWNMVQRAIATNKTNTAGAESSYREHRTSDTSYISDVELDRLLHSPGAPSRSPSPTRPAAESSHSSPSSPTAAASIAVSPAPRGGVAGGACYCYCPGGQAIGKCGHAANATECESRTSGMAIRGAADVRDYCPNITRIYDCFDSVVYGEREGCSFINNTVPNSTRTDQAGTAFHDARGGGGGGGQYDASRHGKKVPSYFGMQYDPIANTSCPSSPPVTSGFEAIRTCTYYPVRFNRCYFVPNVSSCEFSPFFPRKVDV